ncbi:MAG: sulfatase-like hydrolase/transferase [Burkholderiales bacterium]|nr:sulfatase-like hydrolase/transferase [Burkholderiales bacterium]
MPVLLRPAHLFLIFTYLILSAVPFAPLLWGKPVPLWWQVLGIEVIAWLAVWASFKRPAYFHLFLFPAFVALPTEIYLQVFYGQGISTHHLGIIAETSPRESLEFLGQKIWLLGGIAITVLVWFFYSWRLAWRTRALDWGDVSRWVILVLLAIVASAWGYGYHFGVKAKPKASSAKVSTSVASAASVKASIKASPSLKASDSASASPTPVLAANSTASNSSSGSNDSVSASSASASEEDDEDEELEDADESESASASVSTKSKWPKLPHWANPPFELGTFTRSWPFGLMARAVDFVEERNHLGELAEKNRSFTFKAHLATPNTTPQVIVMVIGESSRYDRWSVHGYERETNPYLKSIPNLITLPDVITSVSATRLSVPIILSRKSATQGLKDGFAEKSFLTAFKEAGFKTYWLSNQISFGQFDTPISVFAKEADVVQFMNLGGFTNESNFDQILLEPLKNAMQDATPKKLIVLHSLGSHWNYSHRHPPEFDKWKPSLFGVDKPVYTDLKIKPQLNNSYDNSILYTDWFLSRVIAQLQGSKQISSMLYVADHGQTLYDNSCNLAFHGHNTQYEFHVPAMMWFSEDYAQAFPDKVKRLKRNRKARLSTENIFHSLVDMGDIRYPDERLEWSFLNKKFKQHKRYVDSYGWTNYDNSIIKGDCREVIDKDKPLPQEK